MSPATPVIATQVNAAAIDLGDSFTDTATVTGEPGFPTPTGTVTFRIYGPNNATCTGTPVFTSTNRPLTGGTATSRRSRRRRSGPTGSSRATTAMRTTTRSRASAAIPASRSSCRRDADDRDAGQRCRDRARRLVHGYGDGDRPGRWPDPDRRCRLRGLRPEQRDVHGCAGVHVRRTGRSPAASRRRRRSRRRRSGPIA